MTPPKHTQVGVALSGLIFWCVLIGSAAVTGMRLFPIYNEKIKVDMAMTRVGELATADSTKADLVTALLKQFEVSDIDRWSDQEFAKLLKVGRLSETQPRVMSLTYEIRAPFFGALDLVMVYRKSVPLPKSRMAE